MCVVVGRYLINYNTKYNEYLAPDIADMRNTKTNIPSLGDSYQSIINDGSGKLEAYYQSSFYVGSVRSFKIIAEDFTKIIDKERKVIEDYLSETLKIIDTIENKIDQDKTAKDLAIQKYGEIYYSETERARFSREAPYDKTNTITDYVSLRDYAAEEADKVWKSERCDLW